MTPEAAPVAILVARLGPYHVARLVAAGRKFGAENVLALEIAVESREYAWDRVEATGFRRRTLITDRDYQDVRARELRRATIAALEGERPSAVAVSGWGFAEARAALAWCRARRCPAILMSETQERDATRRWLKESLKRALLRDVDAAFVGGGRQAEYLAALGFDRERIATGYDVVDNEHFRIGAEAARRAGPGVRTRLALPERYLLATARFVPKKNLERLLQAYAMYRRQVRERAWDLVLLGDGPERSALEMARDSLGLHHAVHMPGFKQYDELPAYYGLASAFVLASTAEQWGLVVNEAMASGTPVLVSHACGSSELVVDGANGYRIDPESVADMAHAMSQITADEGRLLEMGAAASASIAGRGPDQFADGLAAALEVAREHLARGRRARIPNPALWF